MTLKSGLGAALCSVAVLTLAACGQAGGDSASSDVEGTGTLDGGGKQIVLFSPSAANVYSGSVIKAATETAQKYDYTLKVFQNDFDQSQQDQQVQQFLASGEKPAAIIWWPSNVDASVNSLRQLSRVAPVIQMNQAVPEEAKQYVKAYAGANDLVVSGTAGQEALKARDEAVAAGKQLADPNGNLIEFRFGTGYKGGDNRHQGFMDATGAKPFTLLTVEAATAGFDAQDGFNHASQIVPKFKAQGIDFVYAQNLDMGSGVVKALEQNGLTPGKDVTVVAGNCSGNLEPLADGSVYAAVMQPPLMEGKLAVRTAVQYLATGSVTDEEVTLQPDAQEPELTAAPPPRATYLPAAALTKDTMNSLTVWGLSGPQLCS
ncbi:substrate-binding domain-containing protein [Pseudonocardia kujensis]|uniref:sugar ABC transporter substrate-binding protein n=1 Tax=Pseudonocardia kujensis TaxID=1128675 RepID=UPI001E2DE9D6|nr:substrate-binding domain-containing protein [Pseudonocardia kujensis]MCE0764913.1 substrate-binding domain-containing protein [Pseudonocardia kujensis]